MVVGFTENGKPLHMVCGEIEDYVVLITVYIPTQPKSKPRMNEIASDPYQCVLLWS